MNEPHSGLRMIYAGRFISGSGFGVGGISAVAPAYVSECSPKEVRGRITGIAQVMVIALFFSFSSPGLMGLTVRNRSVLVA